MNFRGITVAALVVAAVAILVQILGGADYPAIPPGAIILVVTAIGVALVRRWWMLLVPVVVNALLLVGAVATPNVADNIADGGVTRAGGTVLQLVAMVVALVAAVLAIRQERSTAR